jgi:hypothetical protein
MAVCRTHGKLPVCRNCDSSVCAGTVTGCMYVGTIRGCVCARIMRVLCVQEQWW